MGDDVPKSTPTKTLMAEVLPDPEQIPGDPRARAAERLRKMRMGAPAQPPGENAKG